MPPPSVIQRMFPTVPSVVERVAATSIATARARIEMRPALFGHQRAPEIHPQAALLRADVRHAHVTFGGLDAHEFLSLEGAVERITASLERWTSRPRAPTARRA